MPSKVSAVNFGSSNASLSTVGYRVYKEDGTAQAARTTTGVAEILAGTGAYRATITYPVNFRGFVLWDTGEATPNYASESINPVDADSVADEMRTMLRSLNTSLSSHLERLFKGNASKHNNRENENVILMINDLKEKLSAILPHISKEIEKIDFKPELKPIVNVDAPVFNVDMKPMVQCVDGLKDHISNNNHEIYKVLSERNESLKNILLTTRNAINLMIESMKPATLEYKSIINHLKSLTGDFRKSSSNVFSEVRDIDKKYEANFDKKIKLIEAVLNRAVDQMIGEIVKSVTDVSDKLNKKSKAQEMMEKIMESIGVAMKEGKFDSNGKNRYTPEIKQLLIGLHR